MDESVCGLLRGVEKPEARGDALVARCQQFLKPAPADVKRTKASS